MKTFITTFGIAASLLATTAFADEICRLDVSQYKTDDGHYSFSVSLLDKNHNMAPGVDTENGHVGWDVTKKIDITDERWIRVPATETGFIDDAMFAWNEKKFDENIHTDILRFGCVRGDHFSDRGQKDGWSFDEGLDWNRVDQGYGWANGRRNAHLDFDCTPIPMDPVEPEPTGSARIRKRRDLNV